MAHCDAVPDLSIRIIWCARGHRYAKSIQLSEMQMVSSIASDFKVFSVHIAAAGGPPAHEHSTICLKLDEFVSISKNTEKSIFDE